jgi:[protein-PII] uridylyltransferase
MYLHMAMIGRVRDTYRPMVDTRTEFGSDYTELTVVTYDDPKPGLLAKIAGVLYAHDLNVHSAQVFTRTSSDRIAIDTLWVDFRDKPLSPLKRAEMEEAFQQVLTGEVTVADLLRRRGKSAELVQPVRSVRVDDQSSDNYSIVDVQAPDVKGVVYRLAAALSSLGWNIHSARLSTWGGYARNAFYVTDTENRKLPEGAAERLGELLPQKPVPQKEERRRRPSADGAETAAAR